MRRAWTAVALALACASPAAAHENAAPRILSATLSLQGARATVEIVARDRDDVVRGAEISWGDGQPAQGLSACTISSRGRAERRRVGRRESFELSYDYPAAGDYTVSVRVYSGGCGKRPQQRSARRTLTVQVD
jgi:hypothetical protein